MISRNWQNIINVNVLSIFVGALGAPSSSRPHPPDSFKGKLVNFHRLADLLI